MAAIAEAPVDREHLVIVRTFEVRSQAPDGRVWRERHIEGIVLDDGSNRFGCRHCTATFSTTSRAMNHRKKEHPGAPTPSSSTRVDELEEKPAATEPVVQRALEAERVERVVKVVDPAAARGRRVQDSDPDILLDRVSTDALTDFMRR